MGFSCGIQQELAAPGRAERCVLAAGRSQAAQSHTVLQLRVLRFRIVHKKKKSSMCVFRSMTRRRR